MEIMNINHPLLQRLTLEAPGTFQHSVNVANMASAAAKAIGENATLARACGYFHDIGKISKAGYFIENTVTKDETLNSENTLAALQSILASHIRDGLLLCDEYHIPRVIRDVVSQHHGTRAVRPLQMVFNKNESQPSADFLYPGPKPQTKIAAIVMLADSLEMAIRTGELSSNDKLWDLAKEKLSGLIVSGQLEECDISLLELTAVSESLIPVLNGIVRSTSAIAR
jgi:hypothetical protein